VASVKDPCCELKEFFCTFNEFVLGLFFAFLVGGFVTNHISGKEKKELVSLRKACEMEYGRELYRKAGGK
jgi:hypothetical protein